MNPRSLAVSPGQHYPSRSYDSLHYPPPPLGHIAPPPPVVSPPRFRSTYYSHHRVTPPPPASFGHANPDQLKISTLFVSGLPDDVKAREIHNLFRHHHGFDSCQLKYTGRGNQVVAFATFINHQSAMAAMTSLNGAIFDPETRATLHIELARTNSRKRPRGGAAYVVIDERAKVQKNADDWSDGGDGGSDEPSDTETDNSSKKEALAAKQSGKPENKPADGQAAPNASNNIAPCSTLFIANMGPTCKEEDLKHVLSKYSGFHMLKMRGRGGMPVAFADFEDVESSTAAMNSLQGTSLDSSDRGGLHIEYAKSRMRKN
ncbi:hypothetical protein AXF42_Ash011263 [Apostasia shenzhenica]|uniref:RRM domain-containing protein n=1 Tax=Apostasia shenzhenica TaxID=1088818 RepID=A0A2I0AE02_9ASPA|nr:hypothetical protein AXF42_Ash011263 [Apostasia shenzhenica]